MKYYLILILCYSSTVFAQGGKLMDYYFPTNELFTEKTYRFVEKKDTSNHVSWKMKTERYGFDTIFRTVIYDKFGRVTSEQSEIITGGTAKFLTDTLYDYTSTGKKIIAGCKINEPLIFSAKQKVEASIRWSVSYRDFETHNMSKLTKTRTLVSVEKGIATFKDAMKLEIPDQDLTYEYNLECFYKKGKGLIGYNVTGGKAKALHFVLEE